MSQQNPLDISIHHHEILQMLLLYDSKSKQAALKQICKIMTNKNLATKHFLSPDILNPSHFRKV